ncbi:MAG: SpoIIE family protein phosphatase [Spirochaetota bacterium]
MNKIKNIIKSRLQHKLVLVINLIVIGLILIASTFTILDRRKVLMDSMLEKQYIFGRFATDPLYSAYSRSFIYSNLPEEFRKTAGLYSVEQKPVPDSIFGQNRDILRYLIIHRNGNIIFDSIEFKKGYYPNNKAPREAPQSLVNIVNNLEPNMPYMRFVKLQGEEVLEITSPKLLPSGEHLYAVTYYVSLAEINNRIMLTSLVIVLFAAIFILVSSVISILVAKSIVKPIRQLEEVTQKMSEGDYDVKVKLNVTDEIGRFADTFNHMAGRIKEYSEHLEDMVEKRTVELNQANQELSKKNEIMLKELEMAKRVQQSIIPTDKTLPKTALLNFASDYSSMESIGGDLYDVIRVGRNGYGFLMADVSGHGVPAALITTMAKVSFNSNSNWGKTTGEICSHINKELYEFIGDLEHYLTAYYGIINLETGIFSYTNAGHHPAILYRANKNIIEKLDTDGFFIGAFNEVDYETKNIELDEGDIILLFTDGIVETRNNKGEFYGENKLEDYLIRNNDLPPKEFVDGLMKEVDLFCEGLPPHDDRAVLYVEFVSKVSPETPPEEAVQIGIGTVKKNKEELSQKNGHFKNLYNESVNHLKNEEYEKALELISKLLEMDPDNINVLNNLSICYYKQNRLKEAYDVLKKAISIDRNNEKVKKNLGIVNKKLKEAQN